MGRASPPLLFGLAPRGVCRASGVTTGAVGSYPTFSPLPCAASLFTTGRRFCLRPVIEAFCTGGLFSVALSVARASRLGPPGVTRRVALQSSTLGPKTAESGLSSKPTIVRRRLSDHPTYPPSSIIRGCRCRFNDAIRGQKSA